MTTEPTQGTADPVEDNHSKAAQVIGFLFIVPLIMVGLLIVLWVTSMASASMHPYTGSGVITSHASRGTTMCEITVKESNGGEYTYQKGGGLMTCNPLVDGSKVTIKNGTIMEITAP